MIYSTWGEVSIFSVIFFVSQLIIATFLLNHVFSQIVFSSLLLYLLFNLVNVTNGLLVSYRWAGVVALFKWAIMQQYYAK